jgi:hypothetical protein
MIVISYGVEKSGTTLAYEMAKAVLALNGHPQGLLEPRFVKGHRRNNLIGDWSEAALADLLACTARTKLVVKTHHPLPARTADRVREGIDAGEIKLHVVFRDPRDAVLSMIDWERVRPQPSGDMFQAEIRTVSDACAVLRRRLRNLRSWGALPSLKLPYEAFAFDRTFGPRAIAQHLGLEVDPEEVWSVVDQLETKKNVARAGRHHQELPVDARDRIERAFADFMPVVEQGSCSWFDYRPTRKEGLEVHELDDGLVVEDPSAAAVHRLNATAATIFILCTGAHTEADLCELVKDLWELPGPPHDAVYDGIAELQAHGLVT